ncbi:protein enabled homolog [Macrobrachium rosenbergii]|uniref:protein enabled homolog n=1 Tax=Macrobrachium rosenbergii TaxID=79674 RepID=UPI0034D5D5E7
MTSLRHFGNEIQEKILEEGTNVLEQYRIRAMPHPSQHPLKWTKASRSQQNEELKFYMDAGKELELMGQELREWVQERLNSAKKQREKERLAQEKWEEAESAEKEKERLAQEKWDEAARQEKEKDRTEKEEERLAQEKREEAERQEKEKERLEKEKKRQEKEKERLAQEKQEEAERACPCSPKRA